MGERELHSTFERQRFGLQGQCDRNHYGGCYYEQNDGTRTPRQSGSHRVTFVSLEEFVILSEAKDLLLAAEQQVLRFAQDDNS
jgi:hypothetical protein